MGGVITSLNLFDALEGLKIRIMEYKIEAVSTYEVTVHIGLRDVYTEGKHSFSTIEWLCKKFAHINDVCVSITKQTYYYPSGNEEGAMVRFISFPLTKRTPKQVRELALRFSEEAMEELGQSMVTMITPE